MNFDIYVVINLGCRWVNSTMPEPNASNYKGKFSVWLLFFPLFLFNSCKINKEESDERSNVEVEQILIEINSDVNLSSFVKEIEYVPIEESVTIGFVDKILSFKNYMVLCDFDFAQTVVILDENFHLVASISKYGEGPGEYNYISDVSINEALESIDLLSFGKVLRYNFNGEFIEEFPTPTAFTKFQSHVKGGYLVYQPSGMHTSLKAGLGGLLSYWNPYTDSLSLILPDIYGGRFPMISERKNLVKGDGRYYFSMTLSDTIYVLDDELRLCNKYFVDFAGKNVPASVFLGDGSIMEIINSTEFKENYIFHLANLMVDDDKMISGFQGIRRTHGFFMHDFITDYTISFFSIRNDIDSGPNFFIPLNFKDGIIFSVYEYDYFLEHYIKNRDLFSGISDSFTELLNRTDNKTLLVGVKYILK